MEKLNFDPESEGLLNLLSKDEKVRSQKVAGVRTVLVILSSRGMVFDRDSLTQKILLTYPDAVVFFKTTMGKSIGVACPDRVDLLVDFTGPSQRQGWFYSKKLRRLARVAVGRNAGLFRKGSYDRVYDEKALKTTLPLELLERERFVQKSVLELAGIPFSQFGSAGTDRGGEIAFELPRLSKA